MIDRIPSFARTRERTVIRRRHACIYARCEYAVFLCLASFCIQGKFAPDHPKTPKVVADCSSLEQSSDDVAFEDLTKEEREALVLSWIKQVNIY
jgi:hypothetical protein